MGTRTLTASATALVLAGTLSLAAPAAHAGGFGYDRLSPVQKRHVSGALTEALGPPRAARGAAPGASRASAP
ncbi:exo-alpha-sialidase, partial [Actinomadura logoneensis]